MPGLFPSGVFLFYLRGLRALRGSKNLRKRTRFERIVVRMDKGRRAGQIRVISVIRGSETLELRPEAALGSPCLSGGFSACRRIRYSRVNCGFSQIVT